MMKRRKEQEEQSRVKNNSKFFNSLHLILFILAQIHDEAERTINWRKESIIGQQKESQAKTISEKRKSFLNQSPKASKMKKWTWMPILHS